MDLQRILCDRLPKSFSTNSTYKIIGSLKEQRT